MSKRAERLGIEPKAVALFWDGEDQERLDHQGRLQSAFESEIMQSIAISLKRIADKMEQADARL